MILTKLCLLCKEVKPESEMMKSKGVMISRCRECQRKLNKKYYDDHKIKDNHIKSKGFVVSYKSRYDLTTRDGIARYLDSIENA